MRVASGRVELMREGVESPNGRTQMRLLSVGAVGHFTVLLAAVVGVVVVLIASFR
jgi:hypothetical protein